MRDGARTEGCPTLGRNVMLSPREATHSALVLGLNAGRSLEETIPGTLAGSLRVYPALCEPV